MALEIHFGGKEKRLAFGAWPEVSLKAAREKRDEARKVLREGSDPASNKKQPTGKTFEDVAQEWLKGWVPVWSTQHAEDVTTRLTKDVFPYIGAMQILTIQPIHILGVIKKIESRGAIATARRVLSRCSQVFRYGVAMQYVPSDPCRDLTGALAPRLKKNFPALTNQDEIGDLLLAIDNFAGSPVIRMGVLFTALTFCRTWTIRHAEWTEFDFEKKQWVIPAVKMKLKKEVKLRKDPHIVPLATQTLELLSKLHQISGHKTYLFPHSYNENLPMSRTAMSFALSKIGDYAQKMTIHGFRTVASTLLNEAGYRYDVIEAQLAHVSADKVRAAYNRATYMEERRDLMQAWADMLDSLRLRAQERQRNP